MINPWKMLKLMWYMYQVPGGHQGGAVELVADAFIRAAVFTEEERNDVVDEINRSRAIAHCRVLGRRSR